MQDYKQYDKSPNSNSTRPVDTINIKKLETDLSKIKTITHNDEDQSESIFFEEKQKQPNIKSKILQSIGRKESMPRPNNKDLYNHIRNKLITQSVDYNIQRHNPKARPAPKNPQSDHTDRLYNMHKEIALRKKLQSEKIRGNSMQRELDQCTFKPDCSQMKSTSNEQGRVYERNLKWRHRKEVKVEQIKKDCESRIEKSCPFRPNINTNRLEFGLMDDNQSKLASRYKERLENSERNRLENFKRLNIDYVSMYDRTHSVHRSNKPRQMDFETTMIGLRHELLNADLDGE